MDGHAGKYREAKDGDKQMHATLSSSATLAFSVASASAFASAPSTALRILMRSSPTFYFVQKTTHSVWVNIPILLGDARLYDRPMLIASYLGRPIHAATMEFRLSGCISG